MMPRVRFLTPVATAERSYHPGDTADVPGALASAWAKNGNAEIVRGEAVQTPERAEEPVETPEDAESASETLEPEQPSEAPAETPEPAKKAAAPRKRTAKKAAK